MKEQWQACHQAVTQAYDKAWGGTRPFSWFKKKPCWNERMAFPKPQQDSSTKATTTPAFLEIRIDGVPYSQAADEHKAYMNTPWYLRLWNWDEFHGARARAPMMRYAQLRQQLFQLTQTMDRLIVRYEALQSISADVSGSASIAANLERLALQRELNTASVTLGRLVSHLPKKHAKSLRSSQGAVATMKNLFQRAISSLKTRGNAETTQEHRDATIIPLEQLPSVYTDDILNHFMQRCSVVACNAVTFNKSLNNIPGDISELKAGGYEKMMMALGHELANALTRLSDTLHQTTVAGIEKSDIDTSATIKATHDVPGVSTIKATMENELLTFSREQAVTLGNIFQVKAAVRKTTPLVKIKNLLLGFYARFLSEKVAEVSEPNYTPYQPDITQDSDDIKDHHTENGNYDKPSSHSDTALIRPEALTVQGIESNVSRLASVLVDDATLFPVDEQTQQAYVDCNSAIYTREGLEALYQDCQKALEKRIQLVEEFMNRYGDVFAVKEFVQKAIMLTVRMKSLILSEMERIGVPAHDRASAYERFQPLMESNLDTLKMMQRQFMRTSYGCKPLLNGETPYERGQPDSERVANTYMKQEKVYLYTEHGELHYAYYPSIEAYHNRQLTDVTIPAEKIGASHHEALCRYLNDMTIDGEANLPLASVRALVTLLAEDGLKTWELNQRMYEFRTFFPYEYCHSYKTMSRLMLLNYHVVSEMERCLKSARAWFDEVLSTYDTTPSAQVLAQAWRGPKNKQPVVSQALWDGKITVTLFDDKLSAEQLEPNTLYLSPPNIASDGTLNSIHYVIKGPNGKMCRHQIAQEALTDASGQRLSNIQQRELMDIAYGAAVNYSATPHRSIRHGDGSVVSGPLPPVKSLDDFVEAFQASVVADATRLGRVIANGYKKEHQALLIHTHPDRWPLRQQDYQADIKVDCDIAEPKASDAYEAYMAHLHQRYFSEEPYSDYGRRLHELSHFSYAFEYLSRLHKPYDPNAPERGVYAFKQENPLSADGNNDSEHNDTSSSLLVDENSHSQQQTLIPATGTSIPNQSTNLANIPPSLPPSKLSDGQQRDLFVEFIAASFHLPVQEARKMVNDFAKPEVKHEKVLFDTFNNSLTRLDSIKGEFIASREFDKKEKELQRREQTIQDEKKTREQRLVDDRNELLEQLKELGNTTPTEGLNISQLSRLVGRLEMLREIACDTKAEPEPVTMTDDNESSESTRSKPQTKEKRYKVDTLLGHNPKDNPKVPTTQQDKTNETKQEPMERDNEYENANSTAFN